MRNIFRNIIREPNKIAFGLTRLGLTKWMSDERYLKWVYKLSFGEKLDLENPQTFNEKLQWLKINDRDPLYVKLVDKYEVKKHVAEILGEEYVIPTLGVWDRFEDIDFDKLPDKFVLKCTHDSGGLAICRDRSKFNKKSARSKINSSLRTNFFWRGREWPYKNVPHRIIAEQYMEDRNGELNDYKFFCFDGKIDCVMVVTDREKHDAHFYYMSRDWKVLPYGRLTRSLPKDFTLPKPEHLEEMFDIAERLSKGFPCIRIDLYNVDGHIYFGEYTFYNQSGFEDGFDYESNKHLGDQIILYKIKNKDQKQEIKN